MTEARPRGPLKKPRPSLLRDVRLASGELAWPLAQANGILEVTFRERLKRGLSPDEAAQKETGGSLKRKQAQEAPKFGGYDPTFKARMGNALAGLEKALQGRASLTRRLNEGQAQLAEYEAALSAVSASCDALEVELRAAELELAGLPPLSFDALRIERKRLNVATARLARLQEQRAKIERQHQGASMRRDAALAKQEKMTVSLREIEASLPDLSAKALPFAAWVKRGLAAEFLSGKL